MVCIVMKKTRKCSYEGYDKETNQNDAIPLLVPSCGIFYHLPSSALGGRSEHQETVAMTCMILTEKDSKYGEVHVALRADFNSTMLSLQAATAENGVTWNSFLLVMAKRNKELQIDIILMVDGMG